MNSILLHKTFARLHLTLLALLQPLSCLSAQTSPAPTDVHTLSPFEVNSSRDVGYLAKDTLAGSRLNTALKDVAAQVSIMKPEFLQDVTAVTIEDAMRYSLNVENADEFYDVMIWRRKTS